MDLPEHEAQALVDRHGGTIEPLPMDEASVAGRAERERIRRILAHPKARKNLEFTLGLIESDMSADDARVELTGMMEKPK